jgi:DhnA family fructose-bisphosphate aldolase class Ia
VRLTDRDFSQLCDVRVREPQRIAATYASRPRRADLTRDGVMFIVAADHTARSMVGLGNDPYAMADRRSMLDRLLTALENPRVDGVLASADIMDDLVLLGALDNRLAVGTMNRGGLAGATWGLDDRFTAYDTEHIVSNKLDAAKMLLRIHYEEAGTLQTLHDCSRAVQELADHRVLTMVEPIPYSTDANGQHVWDNDPEKLVRAVGVSAALSGSSAYNWLKIQATDDIERVARVTNQPLLLLGGAPGPDPDRTYALWEKGLAQPTVRGLVIGRALLYPNDGNVEAAVARAADLVSAAGRAKTIGKTGQS